ncbi:nitroreductase [Fictibacillus nanhaiensis]|uniref:nitroreductase family protein n=1 Tax=Fictibacillus nanhaiensis TaxID=742169 RepID=UPI002E1BD554|nr:nitroreductase [Fictibacillus nanhaiensis]
MESKHIEEMGFGSESVAKIIRERRSIKEFRQDASVSTELILKLLNDAVWAPNHGLREPWRFILFQEDGRKTLADAIIKETFSKEEQEKKAEHFSTYIMNIPAHLLVVMKADPRPKQWEEDLCATSALIQNFQLLAWEKQLGVIWKTNNYNWDPRFHKAVGIEPGEKVVATLHIGYFDKVPKPRPRTPAEEKTKIILTY